MARKRKTRPRGESRRKGKARKCNQIAAKPSLGDMNPDILMQIIDSAHEIGVYGISHTLAQLNRYLAGIVKLYSRSFSALTLEVGSNVAKAIRKFNFNQMRSNSDYTDRLTLKVFSNTGLTQLQDTGFFSLVNGTGPLKNFSLIGVCHDFKPQISVEAEDIRIDNTWTNSLIPEYAVLFLSSTKNTSACKRLSLRNVAIEDDTYGMITNCENLKLEYTDKCPRGFDSQYIRAHRSGISGTVLAVTRLFKNLKSFTIINSTDKMFFSSCTQQVRSYSVNEMDELEELHLVRVNTFIYKIHTRKLKKLKLEGCTDLENQFRKLNPRLRFLSLAHSRFGRITRLVRYDLLRCVELKTLDLSYVGDEFVDIFVKDKKYLRGLKSLININLSGTNVEGKDVLSCVRRHYPDFEQLKAIDCPNVTIEEQVELIENVPLCQVDINKHVNKEFVFETPHPSAYLCKRSRWLYIGHHGSYYRRAQYTEVEFPQVMPPPPNQVYDTPTEEMASYEWRRRSPPSPPVMFNSIVDEDTSIA